LLEFVVVSSKWLLSIAKLLIAGNGHHIKAVDFDCVDDNAAKKRAEQLVDGRDVELWEHARRIAKFDGKQTVWSVQTD
jgi:hypothetical protein